ncbi:hypothetical protein ACSBR2_030740 [Camellia fascicularis]
MPNADYQLTKLLGLSLSVKRLMMYQQGCYADGMVLHLANDLAKALISDGAVAAIVGSDRVPGVEKLLFELASMAQTILPDSNCDINRQLPEMGLSFHLHKDVPGLISKNI